MSLHTVRLALVSSLLGLAAFAPALRAGDSDEEARAKLRALSEHEDTVMVPMRDGVRLATDVWRPKNVEGPLPTVFYRTPYDVHQLRGSGLRTALAAVERGYAFVLQNERGKFHSEGEWTILGHPRTDGADALDWIAAQEWSNGLVGTIGCSSSAEWQLGLAAIDHPAHAAMVPMASGAGIGRVGPFQEQGNLYRGGAEQLLFLPWLYKVQNLERPRLPEGLDDARLQRLSRWYDLVPEMPEIDWSEKIRGLPLAGIMEEVEGPDGIWAEFVARKPNDPAWFEGGLYHDDEDFGVPALWFNSWYDVSIHPNLALWDHVRTNASDPEVRENQYLVVAPTLHCKFFEPAWDLEVGERSMDDASFPYEELIWRWFDTWLKGEDAGFANEPKVRYFAMGANEWRSADDWPPAGSRRVELHLDSGGDANSLFGDGRLVFEAPTGAAVDRFVSDPSVPVQSVGGGVCCTGNALEGGVFDQREVEARRDVLVYTSALLEEPLDVTGPIEIVLWVSSDARDTDFAVKLVDVQPDGTAFNVDETIQRARYREGVDREAFLEPGEVVELRVSPMVTSNVFGVGHRIRVEIAGSNFPRFGRNLQTGGTNGLDGEGVVARNAVHHSPEHPSRLILTVLDAP